jgi:hypothetical protein
MSTISAIISQESVLKQLVGSLATIEVIRRRFNTGADRAGVRRPGRMRRSRTSKIQRNTSVHVCIFAVVEALINLSEKEEISNQILPSQKDRGLMVVSW